MSTDTNVERIRTMRVLQWWMGSCEPGTERADGVRHPIGEDGNTGQYNSRRNARSRFNSADMTSSHSFHRHHHIPHSRSFAPHPWTHFRTQLSALESFPFNHSFALFVHFGIRASDPCPTTHVEGPRTQVKVE